MKSKYTFFVKMIEITVKDMGQTVLTFDQKPESL